MNLQCRTGLVPPLCITAVLVLVFSVQLSTSSLYKLHPEENCIAWLLEGTLCVLLHACLFIYLFICVHALTLSRILSSSLLVSFLLVWNFNHMYACLYVYIYFWYTESFPVALIVLNLWSSCLSLLSVEITGIHHYA